MLQSNFSASHPITTQSIFNHIGLSLLMINGAALSVIIVIFASAFMKSIAVLCHWYSGRVSQLYTLKSTHFFLFAKMVLIAEPLRQYVNIEFQL